MLLIIDDDPETRGMLDSFARSLNYTPLLAADGREALAKLDEGTPDVIQLDAVMPGMAGFETCRRIKQRGGAANVPVIFMTGLSDTEHVVKGFEAGGVDYVTKPLLLDELAARIRVHLSNARTTRSAITGLESVGARLVSCDESGIIGWKTPEAEKLLDLIEMQAMQDLQALLAAMAASAPNNPVDFGSDGFRLSIQYLGDAGGGDHLFRLTRSSEGIETQLLRDAFGLTPREAEVLLWTSRGKSNKDMSEILNISARTVNKHLEQIFIKVGVENRASAASAATTVLLKA